MVRYIDQITIILLNIEKSKNKNSNTEPKSQFDICYIYTKY